MARSSSTFDDIKLRWDDWRTLSFPSGISEVEINGIELASIDTFLAGCISVYMENQGKLDQERIRILRNCTNELDGFLGHLGEDTKRYFQELSEISHQILDSVDS